MTALNVLNNEYFNWMYDLVCRNRKELKHRSFRRLLQRLHELEFTYSIEYDSNRAEDGTDLRYRFAYLNYGSDGARYAEYLDDGPCSVLEMMLALAIRCEEHIMDDPEKGDRTNDWFWGMIRSLGLYSMDDSKFDARYVDKVVIRLLNREYDENGKGGLFTVKNSNLDLRTVEIWRQMCLYLDDVVGDDWGFNYF